MINIDELTIKQVNQIKALFGTETKESPYKLGQSYLVRTVTHYYTGSLKEVTDKEIVLSHAAWIPNTGRYSDALRTGHLTEVEPIIGHAIIGRGAIVDCVEWKHALPSEKK